MKNEIIFIQHILDNIRIIEDFSKGLTKQDLSENKQKQYAIIRAIEIIGEAIKISQNPLLKNTLMLNGEKSSALVIN